MRQKKIPSTRRSFQFYRIFVASLCGKYACMYLFVCDPIDRNAVFECESIFVAINDNVGGNFQVLPNVKISPGLLKLLLLYYPLHGDARVL